MSSLEALETVEDLPTAADLRAANAELLDASIQLPPTPSELEESQPTHPLQQAKQPSSFGWQGFSWGGLVDAVKKQSEAVVDVYKRDLSELVSVVTTESTTQFDKISHTLKDTFAEISAPIEHDNKHESTPEDISAIAVGDMVLAGPGSGTVTPKADKTLDLSALDELTVKADKLLGKFSEGLTQFLSSAVTIVPGEQVQEHVSKTKSKPVNRDVIFNRKAALLASLKADPSTYQTDPSKSTDEEICTRFKTFQETFTTPNQEIAVLEQDPVVKGMLAQFVPSEMSFNEFWLRYFFRIAEVDREEAVRKELMNLSEQDEEAFSWGSEDEEEEEEVGGDAKAGTEEKDETVTSQTISEEAAKQTDAALQDDSAPQIASAEFTTNPGLETSPPNASSASPNPASSPETSTTPPPNSRPTHLAAKRSMDSTDSFEVVNGPPGQSSPITDPKAEEDDDWGNWE
ncbi:hypothetical protein SpCBS45565_g06652 [Spizellomyces sp. 'palustris']|nr:hypothetical protein SpCBS45565_g06652 [Spizellomyces sp. 'palustris']